MSEPQVVASRYASLPTPSSPTPDRRRRWRAAIKWPMYAVAVMPVLLAAGWRWGRGLPVRTDQLLLFLLAAVLLLAWENLANDVFDADTGVDTGGKPLRSNDAILEAPAADVVLIAAASQEIEFVAASATLPSLIGIGNLRIGLDFQVA